MKIERLNPQCIAERFGVQLYTGIFKNDLKLDIL